MVDTVTIWLAITEAQRALAAVPPFEPHIISRLVNRDRMEEIRVTTLALVDHLDALLSERAAHATALAEAVAALHTPAPLTISPPAFNGGSGESER